jgi:hypothetical protein
MTPRQYADDLVEHLEIAAASCPTVLEIHWDDCDMDERRFWFHFHAPRLSGVRVAGSKEMREASQWVKACVQESRAFLKDCPYQIEWCSSKHDAPEAKYITLDGRKYFDRYESYTWIKVLSFYG